MTRSRSAFGFPIGTGVFGLILIGIVCAIGIVLTLESMASIRRFGWHFLWTDRWDPVAGEFGAVPFLWGTFYSSLLAIVVAAPVALGMAIFMSEFCPEVLREPLAFVTELLAAIPSIVYGLWGMFVLVPAVRTLERLTPDALRGTPLFSGSPIGLGMLTAGLLLAVMVVPFVAVVLRTVLASVPAAQRDGAYALGATHFEAVRASLSYARSSIAGAILLGVGRALGETMAVTMVIGNSTGTSWSLFAPQYTMAAVIVNEFTEAADELHFAALVEIGLLLFVVTLVVNLLSRRLISSMNRRARAAAVAPAQAPA